MEYEVNKSCEFDESKISPKRLTSQPKLSDNMTVTGHLIWHSRCPPGLIFLTFSVSSFMTLKGFSLTQLKYTTSYMTHIEMLAMSQEGKELLELITFLVFVSDKIK